MDPQDQLQANLCNIKRWTRHNLIFLKPLMPSLPNPTHKKVSEPKFLSTLPHKVELTTRIHHKNWVLSTVYNAKFIKAAFPISLLNKVEGETTYQDTHEFHLKLKKPGSIHSDLWGQGNGLLGLVMCPDLYLIMNGSTLNCPKYPVYLSAMPDGSTGSTTSKLVQHQKVNKT